MSRYAPQSRPGERLLANDSKAVPVTRSEPQSWFVVRTLRTLELLAVRPRSVAELAEALAIDPRTARRLLRKLEEQGYAAHGGFRGARYEITPKIMAVAGSALARLELAQVARPYVVQVREMTGEAAHLSIPSYLSALCIVHDAPGRDAVRPQLRELVPAHATAAGKALLAHRPVWADAVAHHPRERYTEYTHVDPGHLRADLETTRARGFALEDREFEAATRAIAAPVFSGSGEAVAALGFAAAASRLVLHEAAHAGHAVAAIAGELSAALTSEHGSPEPTNHNGTGGG